MHDLELENSTILKPISDVNPVGQDLRDGQSSSKIYQQIKDLRSQARTLERQTTAENNVNQVAIAQWNEIKQLSLKALSAETKDLEIATWLLEALVRQNGFVGLSDGFTLLIELLSQYWPEIFPLADEEGEISKLIPLIGLNGETSNGTLITPIYCIPLTNSAANSYSAWHYQQALDREQKNSAQTTQKPAENIVTLEKFETAVLESGREFITQLNQEIEECIAKFNELQSLLDKIGNIDQSIPSTRISNALETCLQIARNSLTKFPPLEAATTITIAEQAGESNSTPQEPVEFDTKTSINKLVEIADFIAAQDPLSPAPYLIRRAIKWQQMSLPELLAVIIPNPMTLKYSYDLLGITDPEIEQNPDL